MALLGAAPKNRGWLLLLLGKCQEERTRSLSFVSILIQCHESMTADMIQCLDMVIFLQWLYPKHTQSLWLLGNGIDNSHSPSPNIASSLRGHPEEKAAPSPPPSLPFLPGKGQLPARQATSSSLSP